jgi:hypothetical protein
MNHDSYRARRTALKLALHHHRASTDKSKEVLNTAEQFRKFLAAEHVAAEHVATEPVHDYEALKAAHNCSATQSACAPPSSEGGETEERIFECLIAMRGLHDVLSRLDSCPQNIRRPTFRKAMRKALESLKLFLGESED